MTRNQWIAIASFSALFLVMYFGCDTKPPTQKAIEKSRALNAESTDINSLLQTAKQELDAARNNEILASEAKLGEASTDSSRSIALKELSGNWYRLGYPSIAGYYAEEVADLEQKAEGWSIAGTTFTLCLQQSKEEKIRSFCRNRAINAFESAISMDPEEAGPRINLALVYTEAPPADQPMKGILMLRELNEKYPENTTVLINLGRLGLQTGQYDRAIGRFIQAYELDPSDRRSACYLAEAYQATGNQTEFERYGAICNTNSD